MERYFKLLSDIAERLDKQAAKGSEVVVADLERIKSVIEEAECKSK